MRSDMNFLGLRVQIRAVIITALAAVATLGLANCDQKPQAAKQDAAAPQAGAPAPKVHLEKLKIHDTPQQAAQTPFQDAEGKTHTLADFAGKVVLVNFWATWCAPCVEEMPTLDKLQASLGGDSFAVVAISQDKEGLKLAQPFAKEQGWKNIVLYVEPATQFMREAKLRGLPTSILVDRQGREVARLEGENAWDAPEMVKVISDLIAKP